MPNVQYDELDEKQFGVLMDFVGDESLIEEVHVPTKKKGRTREEGRHLLRCSVGKMEGPPYVYSDVVVRAVELERGCKYRRPRVAQQKKAEALERLMSYENSVVPGVR